MQTPSKQLHYLAILISLFAFFSIINVKYVTNTIDNYVKTNLESESELKSEHQRTQENEGEVVLRYFEKESSQCLSMGFNETMDDILSKHQQVFVTMPAKAAGSSMKLFTRQCMGSVTSMDNCINHEKCKNDLLRNDLQVHSIVTSHLYSPEPLVKLARHSNRKSLIIYIHRDETDRIISAIKQVLHEVCTFKKPFLDAKGTTEKFNLENNGTYCILDESPVIDIIRARTNEIKQSHLKCNAYDAFEENNPNLVFIHYKQANKLQKLLAKHHCPRLLDKLPFEQNVESEKEIRIFLRLESKSNIVVEINDWLEKKSGILEWALNMKETFSCQGKTKQMEDDLFSCSGEAIRVTAKAIKNW